MSNIAKFYLVLVIGLLLLFIYLCKWIKLGSFLACYEVRGWGWEGGYSPFLDKLRHIFQFIRQ